MTPDELPADMEGAIAEVETLVLTYADNTQYDAFRALLKAYQEQRRAFRALFESISCVEGDGGRRSYGFNPRFWEAYWEAEAALNQKGDER